MVCLHSKMKLSGTVDGKVSVEGWEIGMSILPFGTVECFVEVPLHVLTGSLLLRLLRRRWQMVRVVRCCHMRASLKLHYSCETTAF